MNISQRFFSRRQLVYRFTLLVVFVTLLGGSIVQAASYEKTDGTIVPILNIYGSPHSYSGNNLEPFANLFGADLSFANLIDANLTNAILIDANLDYANLDIANLTNANLTFASLLGANLTVASLLGANLTSANLYGANLTNAILDGATFSAGTTLTDGQTVLQHGYHDDPPGLTDYLLTAGGGGASSASNLTVVPVPEPCTLSLLGIGGLMLIRRNKR